MTSNTTSRIPYCLLRNAALSNSRYRRNLLHGEGLKVKEIIGGLLKEGTVCSSGVDGGFEWYFQRNMIESYLKASNVICKGSCFTSLSKYVKLKQDTGELHKKLLNLIEGSLKKFANSCYPHCNDSPRKRLVSDETASPRKKL